MYQPGKWVPHITLAKSIPTDSLGEALDLSRAINLPFTAQIARIGVVFFDPTQTIYQVKIK
jgi:hypothetical protein